MRHVLSESEPFFLIGKLNFLWLYSGGILYFHFRHNFMLLNPDTESTSNEQQTEILHDYIPRAV